MNLNNQIEAIVNTINTLNEERSHASKLLETINSLIDADISLMHGQIDVIHNQIKMLELRKIELKTSFDEQDRTIAAVIGESNE